MGNPARSFLYYEPVVEWYPDVAVRFRFIADQLSAGIFEKENER